jgi:Na+-driven multidrug efflux pump
MEKAQRGLKPRHIFSFWWPLLAVWVFMTIEQPLLAAAITRMPEATLNLAALWVAISLALFIESPIVQMLSAATALATSRERYRELIVFLTMIAGATTLLHAVIAIPPVFSFVAETILDVPPEVIPRARQAFLLMIPVSAAVGYRRLWQGVLIRLGKTRSVTESTIGRLVVMVGVLLVAVNFFPESDKGHIWASGALIAGLLVGAAYAFWLLYRRGMAELPQVDLQGPIGTAALWKFYVPLASTSVIFLASRPLLTLGMSQAAFPLESLASWPVVHGLIIVFVSVGFSYQEVVIALLGASRENSRPVGRFAWRVGVITSGIFGALALFGGAYWIVRVLFGLEEALLPFTTQALFIVIPVPFFMTLQSWYRGVLINAGRTSVLASAVALNAVVILVLVLVLPRFTSLYGTTIAAIAWTTAMVLELALLRRQAAQPLRDVLRVAEAQS